MCVLPRRRVWPTQPLLRFFIEASIVGRPCQLQQLNMCDPVFPPYFQYTAEAAVDTKPGLGRNKEKPGNMIRYRLPICGSGLFQAGPHCRAVQVREGATIERCLHARTAKRTRVRLRLASHRPAYHSLRSAWADCIRRFAFGGPT